MSFLQSLILGIIQGLTEFLPISSSAHLVLVPFILNWSIPENQIFPFDVLVQLGTLAAVIIYFWRDLWRIIKAFVMGIIQRKPFAGEDARMGWYLVLATIPAGLAGVFLKDRVEAAFNDPRLTAFFLFITAIFLVAAEFFGRRSRPLEKMTWKDALWIGVFQAFSIFPGISRSGSTITGGMTRNFDRPSAARFAFLMSIPIMLAAGIFSLPDLLDVPDLKSFLPIIIVGFIAAGLVGYLSIRWLLSFLTKRSLLYFAAYCVLLGSAVLIIMGIRQTNSVNSGAPVVSPSTAGIPTPLLKPAAIEVTLLVEVPPALVWLRPNLSSCAASIPGLAVITDTIAADGEAADTFRLMWGEPLEMLQQSVLIGQDDLVFIINPANPLQELPLALLQKMAAGEIDTWAQVQIACPECFSVGQMDELIDQPVEFLQYPENDHSRLIFDNAILVGKPPSASSSYIVPSPVLMKEEVAATINTISYLPSQAADTSVKTIEIMNNSTPLEISRPILATRGVGSQGFADQLLACLQSSIAP
ncbi:MAG TPA: undecaprenyl-diphosphatase UppP [Anaerolineaceae bacterium]|nr:undecaprenyl-diphosphatase UppP [Anaerolineaceae bacterium]